MKTIEYNNKTLTLKDDARLTHNCKEGNYYSAFAEDQDGNEYEIKWEIKEGTEELEAEDQCNWDIFSVNKL